MVIAGLEILKSGPNVKKLYKSMLNIEKVCLLQRRFPKSIERNWTRNFNFYGTNPFVYRVRCVQSQCLEQSQGLIGDSFCELCATNFHLFTANFYLDAAKFCQIFTCGQMSYHNLFAADCPHTPAFKSPKHIFVKFCQTISDMESYLEKKKSC